MKFLRILSIIILMLTTGLLSFSCKRNTLLTEKAQEIPDPVDPGPGPRSEWKHFRGFNISSSTTNAVLEELINETGANLIRLSFSTNPMVNKTAPYDFNESAFTDLDRILNWCENKSVRVLIDPHTTPGTRSNFTIFPDDDFWTSPSWHNHLIKLWVRIANTYKNRGNVIAGYDLLNEPAIPDTTIHGDQWNNLVKVLVDTIRSVGDRHTIVVESTGRMSNGYINRIVGMKDLKLPVDDNIVASTNFYEPFSFTHQGVDVSAPAGVSYPGQNEGEYWDNERLKSSMQPIRDFQKAHPDVPIFIGEFSCSRISGVDGDTYHSDLLNAFEKEGWGWTYHEFRGYSGWDAEMPYTTPLSNDAVTRSLNASRYLLLKGYYERNQKTAADMMDVGIYRLNSPAGGQLLTASASETYWATTLYGYQSDGIIFKGSSSTNNALVPVFRLQNPISGDRLYSVDKAERDSVVNTAGYVMEEIGFFASKVPDNSYVPVYVLKKDGQHHYAVGNTERDAKVTAGWQLVKIAFYGKAN